MRLKLTLEYDGTGFRGWAAQPGYRTVEGVLQEALGEVFETWSQLRVAGRTDTGVHALAQVASVDVEGGAPVERAAPALNARLPDDVGVSAAEPAAPLVVSAPARGGAARRVGRAAARRARLPRVHAHRDAAQGSHANDRVGDLAPPRGGARAGDP